MGGKHGLGQGLLQLEASHAMDGLNESQTPLNITLDDIMNIFLFSSIVCIHGPEYLALVMKVISTRPLPGWQLFMVMNDRSVVDIMKPEALGFIEPGLQR